MVTDRQVRRLFDVQNKHKYQYQVADAAGISGKTARQVVHFCSAVYSELQTVDPKLIIAT